MEVKIQRKRSRKGNTIKEDNRWEGEETKQVEGLYQMLSEWLYKL